MPRLRFSIRKLLVTVAVLGVLLALTLRFAPHVLWKRHRMDSSEVVPHPHKPLVDVTPDEDIARCRIGPVSVELPAEMCKNVRVQRTIGGNFVNFNDRGRMVILQLPVSPRSLLTAQEASAFPDKAMRTFPQLHREMAEASSDDFWFGMSHQELHWHQWLVDKRSLYIREWDFPYEYRLGTEMHGVLRGSSAGCQFDWDMADHRWGGTVGFNISATKDTDWIRHACATFSIDGDPAELRELDDIALRDLVQFDDASKPHDQSSRPRSDKPPPRARIEFPAQ